MSAQDLLARELREGEIELSSSQVHAVSPVVSVCMITYNHKAYIGEAIESVVSQRVDFPYEVCIGEDASNDGTRGICVEYARKYPDRIRLFLRNRDSSSRRGFIAPYMVNAAATFAACRGKYVALLDGDDYWSHPHKLRLQVSLMNSDPEIAVCSHYACTLREHSPWSATIIPAQAVRRVNLGQVLRREVGDLHTSTLLLRRNDRLDWNALRAVSFGDYPLFVSSLIDGDCHVIPKIMSTYRQHDSGVFSPLAQVHRLQQNVVLWQVLRDIVPREFRSDATIGLAKTLARLVGEFRRRSRLCQALRTITEANQVIKELPIAERVRLRWLIAEAALLPRLAGLRRRVAHWRRRYHENRSLAKKSMNSIIEVSAVHT